MIRPFQLEGLPALSVSAKQVQGGRLDGPPPAVAKYFHRHGWTLERGGVRATCPKCQPRAEEKSMQASQDAIRAHKMLFRLLDEHFETGHTYEPDWSDERVASECGLAVEEVARVRDAAFGPLPDLELNALEANLLALHKRVEEEGGAIVKMVHELQNTTSGELQALRERAAAVRGRREGKR